MKRRVCILLPGENISPVGGYKIAYQYANALVRAGYEVSIIHSVYPSEGFPYRPPFFLNLGLGFVDFCQSRLGLLHEKWYALDPSIKCYNIASVTRDNIVKADIYIATAICTAHAVMTCAPKDSAWLYFIQGYEKWDVSEDYVLKSYKWPLEKVVVAPWLKDIVESQGESAELVPNSFDNSVFFLEKEIDKRDPSSILFLSSSYAIKGTEDVLEALSIVSRTHHIKVSSFGTCTRRKGAFTDYDYTRSPSLKKLRELYNNAAIFIGGSREDGFGLPVGEAMCCGAAVACTVNGGYQAMVDDSCALQSPIQDPDALARNIIKLLDDNDLRIRLAKAGHERIQEFSSERSEEKFVAFVRRFSD